MKLQTKIKQIAGVALAALMAVSTMAAALPVGAAQGGTITVNAPADSSYTLEGMSFTAYQVLEKEDSGNYTVAADFEGFFGTLSQDYQADETTLYVGYNAQENELVWADAAGEDTVTIDNSQGNKLDAGYLEASLLSRFTAANASANQTLADWLSRYVTASVISGTDLVLNQGNTSASATMASAGYYFVKMTTNGTNPIAIQDNILLLDGGSVVIDTKVDTIDVDKTVLNAGDAAGTPGASDTAAIGDTLNYTITLDVPDFTNYTNPTFTLADTLTNQVLYTAASDPGLEDYFTLQAQDGTQLALSGADSVLKEATSEVAQDGKSFTLDLDAGKLTAYYGQSLTLTYQAVLTADAVQVNGNRVVLTYSNDPYNSSSTDTVEDETEVYTYGLDMTKTFSDGSTDRMAEVVFQLREGDTALQFVELTAGSGQYRVAQANEAGATTDLKPSANADSMGRLEIIGLDAGSYTLAETSAINGFNQATVEITIADNEPDGTLDSASATEFGATLNANLVTLTVNGNGYSAAEFSVVNNETSDLPTTGGAGTWMFTIGGLVLIAGAVVLLVVVRRKKVQ